MIQTKTKNKLHCTVPVHVGQFSLSVNSKISTNFIWYTIFLKILPWRDFISKHCLVRRQFKGGIYRDRYTHAYTAPIMIMSLLYAHIMHVRIRINVVDPLPCGEISRSVFIGMSWQKHAATFQGRWDFEVRQDFEKIRYITCLCTSTHSYTCSMVLN